MNTPLINVMSAAAIKAGKGLLRDFGEVDQLQVSKKGVANFVTATDVRTEKLLHKELLKVRPDFGFLMEEGGEIIGRDPAYRWVIDPIDGTSNFIHAVPYFCISIGLEHTRSDGKREILAGLIYDPIHNEVFAAEKGKGAFVNGRKLTVSSRDTLEDSLLISGNPARADGLLNKALEGGATIRYFGATALDLAYLAAGRIDACWYYNVQPWDIAAGLLLVQEAGGMITQMDGKQVTLSSKALLCTNRHLHLPMQKLLSQAA